LILIVEEIKTLLQHCLQGSKLSLVPFFSYIQNYRIDKHSKNRYDSHLKVDYQFKNMKLINFEIHMNFKNMNFSNFEIHTKCSLSGANKLDLDFLHLVTFIEMV